MNEKDDFWDIKYLRPHMRKHAFAHDTGSILVELGAESADKSSSDAPIPRRAEAIDALKKSGAVVSGAEIPPPDRLKKLNEPELVYKPDGNRLLREVRVYPWPSPYTFYERFRSDARRYYTHSASECQPVPFFSFMPQYVQLNSDQRAWYFYWRSLVRGGKYPPVDFGYVMLYIYELINLSDQLPPASVLSQLCAVWLAYREQHPRLDHYMSEWLCDFCLIKRLPLPYKTLEPVFTRVTEAARFKEFYTGCVECAASPYAESLFRFASGYDWRQSRYLTEENKALFERHIRGAFIYACEKLAAGEIGDDKFRDALANGGTPLRSIRDAYAGALCSYEIKRRVEVDYICCTRSAELRLAVTDMIKYAENNLRAMLGIKSRFGTPNIPPSAKAAIAEYFAPLRAKPKKSDTEAVPEYEKQYEARSASLSTENALELERESWETTSRLVTAFDSEPIEAMASSEAIASSEATTSGEVTASSEATASGIDTVLGNDSASSVDSASGGNSADTGEIGTTDNAVGAGIIADDTQIDSADTAAAPVIMPASAGDTAAANAASGETQILRRAFALLRAGNSAGLNEMAREYNIMTATLVEKLNDFALETVGDIAVEPDFVGDGWKVIADYAEDMTAALNR